MDKLTKETLNAVPDAINQKSIKFEIDILTRNRFHAFLQKRGWAPTKRSYEIRPIVLGNLLRISKLLLTIDPAEFSGGNFISTSHLLIANHTDTLAKIVAIGVQNSRNEPSEELVSTIRDNLTSGELIGLLNGVMKQMDLNSFIGSIILIKGLNVLESAEKKNEPKEVSPLTQGS
ncbi:MAG: hypothetical protein H7Y42_12270 [Chitinophagaceae bacterium]|nr:hypothetical protein [Chitinophagaceae bacterium]